MKYMFIGVIYSIPSRQSNHWRTLLQIAEVVAVESVADVGPAEIFVPRNAFEEDIHHSLLVALDDFLATLEKHAKRVYKTKGGTKKSDGTGTLTLAELVCCCC